MPRYNFPPCCEHVIITSFLSECVVYVNYFFYFFIKKNTNYWLNRILFISMEADTALKLESSSPPNASACNVPIMIFYCMFWSCAACSAWWFEMWDCQALAICSLKPHHTLAPSFPAAPGRPCSPGGPGGPGWPLSPIGPVSPVGP